MDAAHIVQSTLLGDAVEHAEVGIVVWNADRRYVAVNPKAAELTGTTREQLLANPVGSTNTSEEAQAAIEEVLAHVPARGSTQLGDRKLDWIVFPTTIAGLDHVIGLLWDSASLKR